VATLIRWEPIRELAAMQNEMSRWMNGLLEGDGRTTQSWVPAVDVWETEQDLVYAFDLPGIQEDKISVEFEDGALTVTAEREREEKVENDRFYRYERRYGTFSRSLGLPQGVSEQDVTADYRNGVLEAATPARLMGAQNGPSRNGLRGPLLGAAPAVFLAACVAALPERPDHQHPERDGCADLSDQTDRAAVREWG
jgi:HSP20 family protein